MNINQILEFVKQNPCSEHSISILEGAKGKMVVGCEYCKKRWLTEELPNGTQNTIMVENSFVLPKEVIEEVIKPLVKPIIDIRSRGMGKIDV